MTDPTPFFANDAELLLKSQLFDKAIDLCKNGVAKYPLYLSGWLILINALKSAGQIDDAINTTEHALKIFPDNKILISLKKEFEAVFYNIAYDNSNIDENRYDSENILSEISPLIDENGQQDCDTLDYGNHLEDLAKKLAEVSEPATVPDFHKDGKNPLPTGIISETIANIYISQGAYPEAIIAFRNLIAINPDKQNYYLEKISELETKI